MLRTKQLLLNIAFVFSVVVIQPGKVTHANEGSLFLPDQPDANIEFTLQYEVTDIDPAEVLQVFVGNKKNCCAGKSPMAGRYSVSGNTVRFDPAFNLIAGQQYTVAIHQKDSEASPKLSEFMIQARAENTTPEVVAIYPSSSALPENTLRFYIHFSTPMTPHLSTDFIKLIDKDGKADTNAFMQFKQELWSKDRKRLTLLMDPGRIKRGVAQNITLGPALSAGNTYSIIVEPGWPSANGAQTAPGFNKTFSVAPGLRTLPNTDLWKVAAPQISSREPLVITFDRPFDYQLAQSSINVMDNDGHPILGNISLGNNETSWHFVPEQQWIEKSVQITVDPRLEDVAGNNFRDLLDHSVEVDVKSIKQIKFNVALQPQ